MVSAVAGSIAAVAAWNSAKIAQAKYYEEKNAQEQEAAVTTGDRFNFTTHRTILDYHSGRLLALENEVMDLRYSMRELLDSRINWEAEWTEKMRVQAKEIKHLQQVVLSSRNRGEDLRRGREEEGGKSAGSSRSPEEKYRHRRPFEGAKFE